MAWLWSPACSAWPALPPCLGGGLGLHAGCRWVGSPFSFRVLARQRRGLQAWPLPPFTPPAHERTNAHALAQGARSLTHPRPHMLMRAFVRGRVVQVLHHHTTRNGLVHPPSPTTSTTEGCARGQVQGWALSRAVAGPRRAFSLVARVRWCAQDRKGAGPGGWGHSESCEVSVVVWAGCTADRAPPAHLPLTHRCPHCLRRRAAWAETV